jgi:hypothetical protein
MTFLAKRFRYPIFRLLKLPGVYAFSIVDPTALACIEIGPSGLLYVGMTESSLEVRNHFGHKDSSFSSLRRTLGAILKQPLDLHAKVRGNGLSNQDKRCYHFGADGEEKLTAWMKKNLEYGYEAVAKNISARERELIRSLQPPLNLTEWPNPQRKFLMDLRKACRVSASGMGSS